MRKLNSGCGPFATPGWINSDIKEGPEVDLQCDIRTGLPLNTDSIDCIASIHVLQDLPYFDIAPALRELKRVLKPGGVVRIAVPDLDKALHAYLAGDSAFRSISRCDYGVTRSAYRDLASLDNRARESLFVEAAK